MEYDKKNARYEPGSYAVEDPTFISNLPNIGDEHTTNKDIYNYVKYFCPRLTTKKIIDNRDFLLDVAPDIYNMIDTANKRIKTADSSVFDYKTKIWGQVLRDQNYNHGLLAPENIDKISSICYKE